MTLAPDDFNPGGIIDPPKDKRYIIETDEQATWAMRKLRQAQESVDSITRIKDAEIERIREWADKASASPQQDVEFFQFILTEYAAKQRDQHDRKSITTPYGVVRSRSVQPSVVIANHDEAVQWLRQLGLDDAVRVKEQVDVATLKSLDLFVYDGDKLVNKQTGEVVPGVEVMEARVAYSIQMDKSPSRSLREGSK